MDFIIDVGVQSDGYVFRLNPNTESSVKFPSSRSIIPGSLFISFDTMSDFQTIYGSSMFIQQIATTLTGLTKNKLKQQGFSNIVYIDSRLKKELKRILL